MTNTLDLCREAGSMGWSISATEACERIELAEKWVRARLENEESYAANPHLVYMSSQERIEKLKTWLKTLDQIRA